MGETFRDSPSSGPLLLAIGAAALAGLVSFLSPCVLPLVPGYLSYVTGLAGADLEGRARRTPRRQPGPGAGRPPTTTAAPAATAAAWRSADPGRGRTAAAVKGRVLAGTLLFIAGFTAVFTATAILFASIGRVFFEYERRAGDRASAC